MKKYLTVLIVFVLCVGMTSCGCQRKEPQEPQESVTKSEPEYTSDYKLEEKALSGILKFSNEGVGIEITEVKYEDGVTKLKYKAKNESAKNARIASTDISINGFMVNDDFLIDIAANSTLEDTINIGNDWFSDMNIQQITDVEMSVVLLDENNTEIAWSGLLSVKTDAYGKYTQTYNASGTELYNENGIKIFSGSIKKSEHSNDTELEVYIVNNSDKTITVVCSDATVNETEVNPTFVSVINPGKKSFDTVLLNEEDLASNEISEIEVINANFKAFDDNYEIVFETGIVKIPVNKPE